MRLFLSHASRLMPRCLHAVAIAILAALVSSCGHGLEPVDVDSQVAAGFTGTVTVVSAWPPNDSLLTLRVVAFRTYPPTSIIQDFLEGKVEFSEPLQLNVREQTYAIQKDTLSGSFAYIVVAQQYGPNPYEDWHVVGVHALSGNPAQPSPVALQRGRLLSPVDITVDFHTLPPQPF